MDVSDQLRALLGNAREAISNVQKQFNDVSSNITGSYKNFDMAMSKAMTGPEPSRALDNVADGVNRLYTEGNVEEYFKGRGKAAAAGYNHMALNHGGEAIDANIDTSHESVSHDSNADTAEIVVNPEFAHEAIRSLGNLVDTVSGIGGQAINVNIEGAEAIDTAIVENGKRNMEKLNSNFTEIANMMQKYFDNLKEADKAALSEIISSLNQG